MTTINEGSSPPAESERGKRASFDPVSGEVHGAGANAGGSGNPREDYDSDSAGGVGTKPMTAPRPIDDAEQGPRDRHGETYG